MVVTIKDGTAETLERTQERARGLAVDAASAQHDPDEVLELRRELQSLKLALESRGVRFEPAANGAGLTVAVSAATEAMERAQMERERSDVRALLEQQPKVPLEIPYEPGEQEQLLRVNTQGQPQQMLVWRCQINGVIFNVPKGRPVDVPLGIYEMFQRTRLVSNHYLNSRPAGIDQAGYWVD